VHVQMFSLALLGRLTVIGTIQTATKCTSKSYSLIRLERSSELPLSLDSLERMNAKE